MPPVGFAKRQLENSLVIFDTLRRKLSYANERKVSFCCVCNRERQLTGRSPLSFWLNLEIEFLFYKEMDTSRRQMTFWYEGSSISS